MVCLFVSVYIYIFYCSPLFVEVLIHETQKRADAKMLADASRVCYVEAAFVIMTAYFKQTTFASRDVVRCWCSALLKRTC